MKKPWQRTLILSLAAVVLQAGQASVAYAQEEEEPIQARPNPMERSVPGDNRMMKGISRNASQMGMQKGKALGVKEHIGPAATTATQKASSTGHKHDGQGSEDLMPKPEQLEATGAMH